MLLYGTPQTDPNGADFRPSLRGVGYLEERNLLLEYRFAEGKPDRLPELAADLVRQKRDVTAFQPAGRERGEALIVVSSRLMSLQSQRIVDFTAKRRVPMAGES